MAFTNRIRLPFKITHPQYPKDKTSFRFANGSTQTLSVVVKKTYEGQTDWLPEKWHERLVIALEHDSVTIEGDKYLGGIVTDGDYEIDWPKFLDYPTAKAAFTVQVTPFDNTNDNCQTCEQVQQLALQDITFPEMLEEGETYNINVAEVDNICCYPAVFNIVSFNTDYVETAFLDQLGNLSITMKATFFSGSAISLLTYRVTCPNGGFDEADVIGDVDGDIPVCAAPSDIVYSGITASTAEVDFTPASPVPDHYLWKLYRASLLVQLGTTVSPHIDLIGLAPSTEYDLYIRSQCDATDNDDPASVFIHKIFATTPVSNTCGEYSILYINIFGGFGASTFGAYQDCNGVNQNVFIPNYMSRTFCARQTAPGVPVYIDPGAGTYFHGTDSNCNTAPISIKLFVGRGTTTGAVCAGLWPVWISSTHSDIIPGIYVYTDEALTTPLTGFFYISDTAGNILNIHPGTGATGGPIGIAC